MSLDSVVEKIKGANNTDHKRVANAAASTLLVFGGIHTINNIVASVSAHAPRLSTLTSVTLYTALTAGVYYAQQGVSWLADLIHDYQEYRREGQESFGFSYSSSSEEGKKIGMVLGTVAVVGALCLLYNHLSQPSTAAVDEIQIPAEFRK